MCGNAPCGGVRVSVDIRPLPTPCSPLWNDPEIVLALAGVSQPDADYWLNTVSPAAHALAHPDAQYGCPGCPPAADSGDRSAELFWWKQAVT